MATGFWGVVASLWPEHFAKALIAGVSNALGKDFDIAKHFTPNYKPWEQRVCMATEGDLFKVLKDGRASIVTDHVDSFTEDGIRLKSGETLQADMIVTATGLKMKMLGGIKLTVDDEEIDLAQTTLYKAMMFSDVPNLLMFFGYTAASWTLKIDLTASYACRLLSFMEKHDFDRTVPRKRESDSVDDDLLSFSSGYVQRAKHIMPKQGVKVPWRIHQNYFLDSLEIGTRRIDDGILEFDAIATRRPAK
jgi:cation diffusion facilitator CzcD-associated flavoprotein CzcO